MKTLPAFVSSAVVLAAALQAQNSPTSPDQPSSASEDIVVLSPFEVNANEDVGYVGQNTLAGSRFRTNLKDSAAAISPMTSEFLSDIAATNVIEAMEYGVNARVETDDGRQAGPVGEVYNSDVRSIRIRGLPGGSRTVNYFRYFGEVDVYNTERLDVSRGPNSILYGFGSPAGVINSATKSAQTDRQRFSTSLRVDSWEGNRATFDANLPLIEDKLAVRAIYLRGREESWRAAGHDDQDRIYLSGTWRMNPKTTIKVDFENVEQNALTPRPWYGVDLTSVWEAAGMPTFTNYDLSLPAGRRGTPGNPFRDSGSTDVYGVGQLTGSNYVVVSDAYEYAQNYRFFTESDGATGSIHTDFERGRINPETVIEANWGGVKRSGRVYDFVVQHNIARDLNLEVGLSHQKWETLVRSLGSFSTYGVAGDPNLYYPNGELKPVENSLYMQGRYQERPGSNEMTQLRAALAYEHDFGFARLRAAGLAELNVQKSRSEIQEEFLLNGPEVTSGGVFNAAPENPNNRVTHRYYISDPSSVTATNFTMPAPYDLSGGVPYQDPASGQVTTVYSHLLNRNQGSINFYDEKLASYVGVAQLYALKNRLVLTSGYRVDELRHYQAEAIRDPAAADFGHTGVWVPVDPPDDPTSVLRGHNLTLGGVFHLTPWLSAFYNFSTSLSVPASVRVFGDDPLDSNPGTLAPLVDGRTRDFGLKLDLLDHRVFVTATHFKTKVENDTGFSGFTARQDIATIWQSLAESEALPADQTAFAQQMYEYTSTTQGYLVDSDSNGYEFEVVGEVLPGWSVSANYSLTESTRENIAPRVRAHVEEWKSLWLQYKDLNLSQDAATPGPDRTNTYEDFYSRDVADVSGDYTINTDTINERVVDLENNYFNNPFVFEGDRFIGDNKHNINLRTRYDFRHGPLKGLSVGGGMRLRIGRVAGAVASYEYTANGALTDKHNGREINSVRIIEAADQKLFDFQVSYRRKILDDKVNWSLQLNISNLLDEDDLIVNNSDPRSGDPVTYRFQDPRKFILTSTFSF